MFQFMCTSKFSTITCDTCTWWYCTWFVLSFYNLSNQGFVIKHVWESIRKHVNKGWESSIYHKFTFISKNIPTIKNKHLCAEYDNLLVFVLLFLLIKNVFLLK